jgi:hypothetical protein
MAEPHWYKLSLVWVLIVSVGGVRSGAVQPGGHVVRASAYGFQLTLNVPKQMYPRNALVRLSVRLSNISAEPVMVETSCKSDNPSVEVVRPDGTIALPPVIPFPPLDDVSCALPPLQLQRGESQTSTIYAVLRARHIRAVVALGLPGTPAKPGREVSLRTPSVSVRLTQAPAPSLTMHTGPEVHATVHDSAGRGKRSYLYTDWYRCQQAGHPTSIAGQTFYETGGGIGPAEIVGRVLNWSSAKSSRLKPGCAHPLEWHVAVARLNHPVVSTSYPGA